jgi:DNA-binding XRE family transcriptional regulator
MSTDMKPKHAGGRPGTGSGPVWEWRKAAGLTQAEAAARLGCHVAAIVRCEKNGTRPAGYTKAAAVFETVLTDS